MICFRCNNLSEVSLAGYAHGGMTGQEKVGKVMSEFKHGKLKTHGKKVTDRKQAVAIALSEAGLSRKK
jgi:hypothetical protein